MVVYLIDGGHNDIFEVNLKKANAFLLKNNKEYIFDTMCEEQHFSLNFKSI